VIVTNLKVIMPPIKVEASSGPDDNRRLPDINPGDVPASFSDGSTTLMISCSKDDKGGFVSRQVGDGGELLFNRIVRAVESFADPEAIIPENGSYVVSIRSKVGLVTLTLTHYQNEQ